MIREAEPENKAIVACISLVFYALQLPVFVMKLRFVVCNQRVISYCFIKWKEENNEEKCYGNRILCCGFSIYD